MITETVLTEQAEKTGVAIMATETESSTGPSMESSAIGDFSQLDTKTPAETGADLILENPKTGEPIRLPDGSLASITFMGPDSAKVRAFQRKHTDDALEAARKGKAPASAEANERRTVGELAAITLRWNVPALDGQPIPCTEANAKRLYGDPRLPWIVEQSVRFVTDRARFFKSASSN